MDDFKDDEFDSIIRVISFTLQEASTQNELLAGPNLTLTRFNTLQPPKIPILNYLRYLRMQTKCTSSCFISAMILLDKLLKAQTQIKITPNTVHKLFLCSIMTATKFNTDINYSNSVWAQIGGVRQEEMNVLELEFLFFLQFSLVITKDEFEKYEKQLKSKIKLPPFNHVNHANGSQKEM